MTCARCHKPRCAEGEKAARGLCSCCYKWAQYHGLLWDYPRLTLSRNDLLDDYVLLREAGYTWKQCAVKLHMKYSTFERAMMRARAAGDSRALRIGERALPNREKVAV